MELNRLPEDYNEAKLGPQKRQTTFDSPQAKLAYDAKGLIQKAKLQSERLGEQVDPITFAQRVDDDIQALRLAIAKEQRAINPVEETLRQLSPEEAEMTLLSLSVRFQNNMYLHEGVRFEDVKIALEANPAALWSVAQMQKTGHQPDVYNFDRTGFEIGTCAEEAPFSSRNCVYDLEAADLLKASKPRESFNGSAVERTKEMGISLMDPNSYQNILQQKGKFDLLTSVWLLTHDDVRSKGEALSGSRRGAYDGEGAHISRGGANEHHDYLAFRGSLRVFWKKD